MQSNRAAFIALVWPPNGDFDSPLQGYHVTPGDSGGGTKGGVIEATWQECVAEGLVTGTLVDATDAQLQTVLYAKAWGTVCDALPSGVDLMVANGQMMSGAYPRLLQQCLGFTGSDVDGDIGPKTQLAAHHCGPRTLMNALHGRHYAYLSEQLAPGQWEEFGDGWTRRLVAAHAAALALGTG